jgi:hypothetical protein
MKSTPVSALLGIFLTQLLDGCAIPNSRSFAHSPEQAEANRQNTARIEEIGRDQENIERMRRAQATEVATRHAPTSVSNTQIFAPRF